MSVPISLDRIDDTRHLLQRAGLAASGATVVAAAGRSSDDPLALLLDPEQRIADSPPPSWAGEPLVTYKSAQEGLTGTELKTANRAHRRAENARLESLQAWWLRTLIRTRDPLGARMTLFWQNHFTSSYRKVRYAQLLLRQHRTLARHAMGDFGELLRAVLHDPAMLLYLDGRQNQRGRTNENLARELLELFTLGEGNYTESDVKEVARALTGLTIDVQGELDFTFRERHHDTGTKTVFGHTGEFDVDDVVALILRRPETGRFVATKLWRHFVSPEPDEKTVANWGRRWQRSNYDIRTLIETVLTSKAFVDPVNRGRLVKSPVEFVVATHRVLELAPTDNRTLVRAVRAMQQEPFQPPNVRGWVGGRHWINSHTLLARQRFVNGLLSTDSLDRTGLERRLGADALSVALLADTSPGLVDLDECGRVTSGPRRDRRFVTAALLRSPAWHLA